MCASIDSVSMKRLLYIWFKVALLPQVPVQEVLECKVFDNDTLSEDDMLGIVEVDIAKEVASSPNMVSARAQLQGRRSSAIMHHHAHPVGAI